MRVVGVSKKLLGLEFGEFHILVDIGRVSTPCIEYSLQLSSWKLAHSRCHVLNSRENVTFHRLVGSLVPDHVHSVSTKIMMVHDVIRRYDTGKWSLSLEFKIKLAPIVLVREVKPVTLGFFGTTK